MVKNFFNKTLPYFFDYISKLPLKYQLLYLLHISLIIGLCITQLYTILHVINKNISVTLLVYSCLGSICACFALINNLIRATMLKTASQKLDDAQLTIQTLTILHDTVRTFKHDFDNIIHSIGGYIKTENVIGLKTYYNQLVEDCQKTNNLYSLTPDAINDPAIYNLLATKYFLADEYDIQINLDLYIDMSTIQNYIKIYEFTRIFGILLDNAIEACKDCEQKIINIYFVNNPAKNRLEFIVENTYLETNIDINNIYEKGFSSKTNHSGIGLWKVKQILSKNTCLDLFTTKNRKYFKQQFELYLKPRK